jgi:hypothetical protein
MTGGITDQANRFDGHKASAIFLTQNDGFIFYRFG